MSDKLMTAVLEGDVAALQYLLHAGVDVCARDAAGATPLMHAAHRGSLPMVELLLPAGYDVDACDALGWSALTRAIYNTDFKRGFPDIVRVLIAAGANLEAPIGYGVRPLMLAAGYGETETVELLLQAGADVFARNEGGYTALMMVKQKHYVDVINLLHEAEQLAGEGNCDSRHAPGSNVVTFMKRPGA